MKFHDLLNKTTKSTATPASLTVRNLIILDASGSMQLIYTQALTGVNETLQTIRQAAADNSDMPQTVTLSTFSTMGFNNIYDNVAAGNATDINPRQFCPNGGTPLYDAIGRGIQTMEKVKRPEDSVLVTIVTDGEENSSVEFTGQAIRSLIEQKRSQGWVFTYIGANQNVVEVAESLSIKHSLAFAATASGTADMWMHENNSRRNFYSNLKGKMARMAADPNAAPAQADDEDFSF